MSVNQRNRCRNSTKNRHSSYIPPTEPLDVLSLLSPSAKSKYTATGRSSSDLSLPKRSSVSKVVYSIKSSDGTAVEASEPTKRNIFGRSGIYGALESALAKEEEISSKEGTSFQKSERKDTAIKRSLPYTIHERKTDERSLKEPHVTVESSSVRSRIMATGPEKATVTKRVLPETPDLPTVRRVSYDEATKPESIQIIKSESEDSGCDENFEETSLGTPSPHHRVASVTSIDSLLGPGSPRTSSTSPDLIPKRLSNLTEENLSTISSTRSLSDPLADLVSNSDPDEVQFVTMETSMRNTPAGIKPFKTDTKLLEKKTSNTKLPTKNVDSSEKIPLVVQEKVSVVKRQPVIVRSAKVCQIEKPVKNTFHSNDKIMEKIVKRTKTYQTSQDKPPKGDKGHQIEINLAISETQTDGGLLKQEISSKIIEKQAEKEPEPERQSFHANDKIMEKLIRRTKTASSLVKNDDDKKEKAKEREPADPKEVLKRFSTHDKMMSKIVSNTVKPSDKVIELKFTKTVLEEPAQADKESVAETGNKAESVVKENNVETSQLDPMERVLKAQKKKISFSPKPPAADKTSPVTPVSPLVVKIEQLNTSPASSSDESDMAWKAKILSSRNLMRGTSVPSSITLLRPLVSTIIEGPSDVSDQEDIATDLPVFTSAAQRKAKFARQYSTPVHSPKKEQSTPLQPAKRRKSQARRRALSKEKVSVTPQLVLDAGDFEELQKNLEGLGECTAPVLQSPFKNNIRPNRRTTTSTNPVKLRQEIEKQHKEQEEKENLKKKLEQPKNASSAVSHWKKASTARLAASAINGLQMTIDFANAKRGLKKTEKNTDGTAKVSKAAGEESTVESKFPEKMLLQLKGRKNVQCCLVECRVSSLNSGDVFILISQTELFHFVGQDANVHEKAKGNDLVDRIVRNKEMGCTATRCITLHERDMDMVKRDFKRFFEILGGRPPIAEKESVIDDKEFEKRYQQEARVCEYREDSDDDATPSFIQINHGKRLRYELLDSKKTFILDFITEYYIWCGKGVSMVSRKKALQLAEQLYQKSKTECPKNPINPPQGRRSSVAMTAGALPSTQVSRRISCASRGSIGDTPSSVKLTRRSSSNLLAQRSISSDNVTSRRVSLSINSRASLTKVSSADNLRRMSTTSSLPEHRNSISSQGSGRRMSTSRRSSVVSNSGVEQRMSTSRRSSVVSNSGSQCGSRRSSLMSTCSVDSGLGTTKGSTGRRVSVSLKQLKSLVTGSGRRVRDDNGTIQVERPAWGINTVTIQGKEPIALREKFSDWPEPGRIIKMKGHAASGDQQTNLLAPSQALEPYPAELMHKPQPLEEILKLENTKLGRGRGTFKSYDEEITVITDDVKTWLVHEYKNYILPKEYQHMLYSTEGYVIRWEYHLEEYDGFVRKNKSKRCAYFFWQGSSCEVNLKGATALMTVELDKEKGPQVRVVQNREPPSFLNLFRGKLVVRTDRRQQLGNDPKLGRRTYSSETEMFVVRGECVEETHLHQVEPRTSSLRSRGCCIIVTPSQRVYVWLGSKCTPHARDIAKKAGRQIEDNYISKHFKLVIIEETKEPSSFFSSLGGHREDYHPLHSSIDSHLYTPRLFKFDSTSGRFQAEEVLCKYRVPDRDTQFPFIQSDLYGAGQPALFLLDAKYQLWLWQGWFETADDAEKVTGSARQIFARNKKVAMETVNNYVEGMMLAENPKVFPIEAGYEPVDFITLFPFWKEREDVKMFSNKKIEQNGARGRRTSINTAYKILTRTEYTLEELIAEPKPEGVDPSRLDDYLSDEEFMRVFKMNREEFQKVKKWKQVVLKKQKGLY